MTTIHRADWIQSTAHSVHPDDIAHALLATWPDLETEPTIPQKGYATGLEFRRGGDYFCDLSHGGRNGEEYGPHLRAKSVGAADCIDLLRDYWPDEISFSRLDMAFDTFEEGDFDRLVTTALDVARESRRTPLIDQRGNHIAPDLPGTRTLNLGARKSAAYLRIYERGLKLQRDFPERASEFDPKQIRAEIEVKPQTAEGKQLLARAPLSTAWGASEWSQKFASRALGEDVDRIAVGSKQSPLVTMDSQYRWLLRSTGKIVAARVRRTGGWEEFAAKFRDDLRALGHDV